MHNNNHKWFQDLKKKYPEHFSFAKVLEVGSKLYSGESIRFYFEECEYIGVDTEAGTGVDIIGKVQDIQDDNFFTIVCLSVFEHDKDWRGTLKTCIERLHSDGMMFICFGAEGNDPHMVDTVGWEIVPRQVFLDFCDTLPVRIEDAFFEEDRYGKDCRGAYNLVLKKCPVQ